MTSNSHHYNCIVLTYQIFIIIRQEIKHAQFKIVKIDSGKHLEMRFFTTISLRQHSNRKLMDSVLKR